MLIVSQNIIKIFDECEAEEAVEPEEGRDVYSAHRYLIMVKNGAGREREGRPPHLSSVRG